MKLSNITLYIISFFLLTCSTHLYSLDIIKVNRGHSEKDSRHLYNWQVIKQALELTKPKYGDYKIKVTGEAIPNHQRLRELQLNRYLNVAMTVSNPEWENAISPIRVPIRLEALKYRLLLIQKKDEVHFSNVNSLSELQAFSSGVRQSWTTKDVLIKNNFVTLPAYSYEALFAMLNKGRFDFILRGVHEIYPEFESRIEELSNLMIETHLVIEIPNSYYYVYVSPLEERIKHRLQLGLTMMQKNGDLQVLFDQYYGKFFTKAALHNRTKIQFKGLE